MEQDQRWIWDYSELLMSVLFLTFSNFYHEVKIKAFFSFTRRIMFMYLNFCIMWLKKQSSSNYSQGEESSWEHHKFLEIVVEVKSSRSSHWFHMSVHRNIPCVGQWHLVPIQTSQLLHHWTCNLLHGQLEVQQLKSKWEKFISFFLFTM